MIIKEMSKPPKYVQMPYQDKRKLFNDFLEEVQPLIVKSA